MAALRWISRYCTHARYVLKTDDDIFVNAFNLLRHLSRIDRQAAATALPSPAGGLARAAAAPRGLLLCLVWYTMTVMREGKWKVRAHSAQLQSKFTIVKFVTRKLVRTQNTHTHTHLTAIFPGLPGWAGTRKVKPIWILLKQETVSGSGISWAMYESAPRCRQITTPAPHHSVFYRLDALPAAQPTASKH